MSITHGDACKVALAEALNDFASLSGSTTPTLRVFDAGATLLVTIALDVTSVFTVSTAQTNAAINGSPTGVAVATGTPASFDILNGNGDTVYEGEAGIAGSTVELALDVGTEITLGEVVGISSHDWELF